jgi:regulator of sigma E protease
LGIGLDTPRRPATASEVIIGGFTMTGLQAVGILSIPVLLIQNAIEPELARPIGLVGMFGAFSQAVERDTQTRQEAAAASSAGEPAPLPTNYTLLLLASLSVSLGVFNLLPIPALDGGRIVFTLPEILFRRRVPYRFENVVNGVAFLVLISLMIFINVMDFINPANFQLP